MMYEMILNALLFATARDRPMTRRLDADLERYLSREHGPNAAWARGECIAGPRTSRAGAKEGVADASPKVFPSSAWVHPPRTAGGQGNSRCSMVKD
ncbi:MAG: hypothetical protein JSV90_00820 [Methanobacteriota archaeon]|nr:MAG: hypothetical protein JSV90_00820 [Euryarchaeota archaeon]